MQKSVLRILLLVCLIGGLGAYAATPASAAPPFAAMNFNPQDATLGADGIDRLVLTDKFDGVDTLAHLTGVATADTTSATWVVCPDPAGFPPPDAVPPLDNPIPPPGCQIIGTDTQGEQAPGFQGDLGFELFWDIPSSFDEIQRSVGVYYCTGTATTNEPGGNCLLEVEPNVFIDDGQSGLQNTTAAEFLDWCVNLNADSDCNDAGETTPQSFDHPEALPNLTTQYPPGASILVRARSSDDGISTLTLCVDFQADAQNPPDACSFSDSAGGSAAAAYKEYTYNVTYPDNAEMAFFLHNLNNDGTGYCNGFDCLLDSHYVVSSEPAATTAGITFLTPAPGDPVPPGGPSPAAGSCEPASTERTNQLGEAENVRFCLTDQFGNPFSGPVTFVSEGPEGSGFTACPGGVLHDHDADGRFEHCHTTTGANGTAQATISNFTDAFQTASPGTQTVTACSDLQNDPNAPPTNPVPAGHGCADETVTATVTKHWVTAPSNVELVFFEEGVDAQTLCLTGDKFKENVVGDQDTLVVCTFDASGNFVSTEPVGNGRLQWFIAPSGGGELTATRFAENPPNETGTDGTNTTLLEAFRQGNDIITVCLQNDPGGNATGDCDAVQKRVTQTGGGDGDDVPAVCASNTSAIIGTQGDDVLVGTQGDDVICGLGGDDTISGEDGNDLILSGSGNDSSRGGPGRDSIRGQQGDDALTGGRGKDVLRGGGGNDSLKGNKMHDTLRGGAGNDSLRGGFGRDINNGGAGNDVCIDRFGDNIFRNCETIRR